MIDYDLQKPQYSPLMQLAILLMLVSAGFLIGSFVTLGVASAYLHVPFGKLHEALENLQDPYLSRLLQFVATFFIMAIPSCVFARIMNPKPFDYIGFNRALNSRQVFLIIGIVFLSLIVGGALSEVNARIPLPKSAEQYFKGLEDKYYQNVIAIADMKSLKDYVISLFMIALLPAIFEEMLFRGALQPVMIHLIRNSFLGILITSILFSAIHASYYGFLTRLALGLIIGYVFYFSKNLWPASIIHFLYNAAGVTQIYMLSRRGLLTRETMNDDSFPVYYGLLAAGALYIIFIFFRKESEMVLSMFIQRKKNNNEEVF
ncbi:MAG TPA: CPBP family intramembrane glutamic endopeptidase [Parafilimonas sp.]|nr:CPBP family intramembrane glutamic endopeptidase [Parafilimonas sp.]